MQNPSQQPPLHNMKAELVHPMVQLPFYLCNEPLFMTFYNILSFIGSLPQAYYAFSQLLTVRCC